MLIVDPPEIKIRDLFSTNGTYVDDERLIPKVKDQSSEYDESYDRLLKHGDRISVGGVVFLVEVSSELNPEQSDRGYSAGIYTTKTTKTRLIPFERATTRSGSLIPQEKLPPNARTEAPEEPSETQRLLSMPITEPIPREMFLATVDSDTKEPFAPEEDNEKQPPPEETPKQDSDLAWLEEDSPVEQQENPNKRLLINLLKKISSIPMTRFLKLLPILLN